MLTVRQVAQILGYHPYHVRRLLRSGVIRGEKFGTTWMVNKAEAERVRREQVEGRLYHNTT